MLSRCLVSGTKLDRPWVDPPALFVPCSDLARLSWAGDLKVWKEGRSGSRLLFSESRRGMSGLTDWDLEKGGNEDMIKGNSKTQWK